METVKERVRQAILSLTAGFEAEIALEDVAPDKVAGEVVSTAFEGVGVIDRQTRLWDELDKRLDRFQRTRIVIIMTITPNEKQVLSESA
jgi:hypothetical protein